MFSVSFNESPVRLLFFFFNDTATTEIYTLSLHDALPIYPKPQVRADSCHQRKSNSRWTDRKSTRLNSSHQLISYAVFCLKKKKKPQRPDRREASRNRMGNMLVCSRLS